jgi:hypothetical protein
MKMYIGDDYYMGVTFESSSVGKYDVPDDVANRWISAEAEYRKAQDEASSYL